ncbi:ATP-binding protein [uncultured Cloacibacillus sp.]|uniref:ATP-binding protein n=1 Tax=uncultured Cloacibacillus sp. TaxID=889794 RepID=UPI00261D3604|nr:ATP-binding protein [uncultured Cloacibacillus sp.]
MFYCRESELRIMNNRYDGGGFECVVIYGRRRVGKTALINEFCKDKPVIFFSALNASSHENLEALSKAVWQFKNPEGNNAPVYSGYDGVLEEITALSKDRRLVFVIDEFPYLAKAEESISSRLQHIIDHVWQNSRLYLILCGSSMSFMENQVLGYQSPLYGRRTAQIKVKALTYREMTVFRPHLSLEDQALQYGITGGIPHYVNKLDVRTSIDDAVLDNLLDTSSYLFEEPGNLLKQELREPAIYNTIISAVAGGASRVNEIATKTKLTSAVCGKYLRELLELEILQKETPIGEKAGKRTIYNIRDNFFRFWYRFVPGNMSAISTGRIRRIYDAAIKRLYPEYMGLIFEKMCRDYLMRYDERLPFIPAEIGQWWGTDPETHKQVQIDIVGVPASGDEYLIGSCKYKNEKVGIDEFRLLQSYAAAFRRNGKFRYCIFSKSGFTEQLAALAGQEGVALYTLEDIYGL